MTPILQHSIKPSKAEPIIFENPQMAMISELNIKKVGLEPHFGNERILEGMSGK